MIKRIIGNLFAWATLALIVVVVLHRDRYTSLIELRPEPATAEQAAIEQAGMTAAPSSAPDSVKLPAAGVLPAKATDSAGMAAQPAPVPQPDTTVTVTTATDTAVSSAKAGVGE